MGLGFRVSTRKRSVSMWIFTVKLAHCYGSTALYLEFESVSEPFSRNMYHKVQIMELNM